MKPSKGYITCSLLKSAFADEYIYTIRINGKKIIGFGHKQYFRSLDDDEISFPSDRSIGALVQCRIHREVVNGDDKFYYVSCPNVEMFIVPECGLSDISCIGGATSIDMRNFN